MPILALCRHEENRQSLLDAGAKACVSSTADGDEALSALMRLLPTEIKVGGGGGCTSPHVLKTITAAASRRHDRDRQPIAEGMHVLVVDDSIVCLKIFSNTLRDFGLRITICSSGQAALELLVAEPKQFDMLIVDLFMPGMSGLVLTSTLRSRKIEVPIILMTTSEEFKGKAVSELGVQACIMV